MSKQRIGLRAISLNVAPNPSFKKTFSVSRDRKNGISIIDFCRHQTIFTKDITQIYGNYGDSDRLCFSDFFYQFSLFFLSNYQLFSKSPKIVFEKIQKVNCFRFSGFLVFEFFIQGGPIFAKVVPDPRVNTFYWEWPDLTVILINY